jgi:hypothetical protein
VITLWIVRSREAHQSAAQLRRNDSHPKIARAGSRIRTDDRLITNQLLYQLSYAGKKSRARTDALVQEYLN